jgi:hypothetical protein
MDKTFEFKFFDGQVFRGPGRDATDALNRLGLGAYNPVAYDVEEVEPEVRRAVEPSELDQLKMAVRDLLLQIDFGPRWCYGTTQKGEDVWKGSFHSRIEKLRALTKEEDHEQEN